MAGAMSIGTTRFPRSHTVSTASSVGRIPDAEGCRAALSLPFALAVFLGLSTVLTVAGTARGQAADALAIEPVETSERRGDLYRELAKQGEILEKQAAVVKMVARLAEPTVVYIEADATERPGVRSSQPGQIEEAGSGVIVRVNEKPYILTNGHIIKGASPEHIRVRLADGRQIQPAKVWEDPKTDVAVLAVDAPGLVTARIGDSDKIDAGDFVLAVGSPFGLTNSVTFGIISAKGRRDLMLDDAGIEIKDFLQTDAAINPGNSGGPLLNLQGEVIGINAAIASNSGRNEGIGFSIPVNMFMAVARQLIEHGKVSEAYLGVKLDRHFGPTMAAEIGMPRPVGARIVEVVPGSPAAAADLKVGDVIIQFDGMPVEDDNHLINLVRPMPIGKRVALVVFREGKPVQVKAEVADRNKFESSE